MNRILPLALACALTLSLLSACGGKSGGSSSSGSQSGGSSSGSSSQTDGSSTDVSTPDASQPDASNPSGSGGDISIGDISFTLNRTDITLNKAGATFQLRYTINVGFNMVPQYSSSDESVAKVDDQGKITAVAPGTAVITAEHPSVTDLSTGKYISAACTVTCDWKEETKPEPKPEQKPDPSSKPEPEHQPDTSAQPTGGSSSASSSSDGAGSSAPAPSSVDLQSFYDAVTGEHEFGFLELADGEILDAWYPGLSGIATEQCLVYITQFSMNNGEFGLVQVKDSKDVDAVKAIFQARIDYMSGADGGQPGAWYPGPTEQWASNSTVVSNGTYIMMVVHENYSSIVEDFNALF